MRKLSLLLGGILIVLILVAGYLHEREDTASAPTQGNIPNLQDLTFTDLQGRKVSLNDYRGKVVLLNFWATWCPPCREEMPMFEKVYQRYKEDGFVILAVNMDENKENLKDYLSKERISFEVLLGNEEVAKKTGLMGFPTSYLLGKDGKVCKVRFGVYREIEEDIKKIIKDGGSC